MREYVFIPRNVQLQHGMPKKAELNMASPLKMQEETNRIPHGLRNMLTSTQIRIYGSLTEKAAYGKRKERSTNSENL